MVRNCGGRTQSRNSRRPLLADGYSARRGRRWPKAGPLAAVPAVVQALWAVHAAAFGLDLAAIAVALIGLSYAAASVRLIPAWLTIAAWPGAACLLITAVFTVALANGGPWVVVGLAGFVIWLVFVITASVSLLRERPIP